MEALVSLSVYTSEYFKYHLWSAAKLEWLFFFLFKNVCVCVLGGGGRCLVEETEQLIAMLQMKGDSGHRSSEI